MINSQHFIVNIDGTLFNITLPNRKCKINNKIVCNLTDYYLKNLPNIKKELNRRKSEHAVSDKRLLCNFKRDYTEYISKSFITFINKPKNIWDDDAKQYMQEYKLKYEFSLYIAHFFRLLLTITRFAKYKKEQTFTHTPKYAKYFKCLSLTELHKHMHKIQYTSVLDEHDYYPANPSGTFPGGKEVRKIEKNFEKTRLLQ